MENPQQTIAINSKNIIAITGTTDHAKLEEPMFAINWLNLRAGWLYRLYTLLAYPHVRRVGGRAIFKGEVVERLRGNSQYDRKLLLVVRYPNAGSFLKMISSKVFQLKSLLRIRAIRDFVFGFAESDSAYSSKKQNSACMIHFTRLKTDYSHSLLGMEGPVRLLFIGSKKATIGRLKDGKVKHLPFFVEDLLIWEADSEQQLKTFIQSDQYLKLIDDQGVNNAYLVNRSI